MENKTVNGLIFISEKSATKQNEVIFPKTSSDIQRHLIKFYSHYNKVMIDSVSIHFPIQVLETG